MGGTIAAMARFIVKLMDQRTANEVEQTKADFAVASALKEMADQTHSLDVRLTAIDRRLEEKLG